MPGWAAEFWQDEELADMDVVLAVEADSDTSNNSTPQQLCKLPGHRLVLSRSPFLKAQVLRWQRKRPAEQQQPNKQPASQPPADTAASPDQLLRVRIELAVNTPLPDDDRPQVVLTLQDAAQEPAARAVLAFLYDKPLPDLLSGLSQEEQLSAAVLADMWDVAAFSTAAADGLLAAALSATGLEHTVSSQLLAMQAYPSCLIPVVEAVLLSTYSDLEAVWRDSELQKQLLALPLAAFTVLLSSDKLKVASEDTVLYTAQQYVDSIQDEQQQQASREQLASLIRCPQLSLYWLTAAVEPDATDEQQLLHTLSEHVWKLLKWRVADPNTIPDADEVRKYFPGAPDSWALPDRPRVVVDSVEVTWSLPVSELRAAAQTAASTQQSVALYSRHTPPLRGLTFKIKVECKSAAAGTSTVGLSSACSNAPIGMYCGYRDRVMVPQARIDRTNWQVLKGNTFWGWPDFFGVGPMAGGWDDAATAAKSVPTSGNLDITLRVIEVGHGD